MENKYDGGLGAAADAVPRLVETAKATDAKIVAFVRERPLAALVTALAVGYVVGRVVSRFG
jgi:hypothetical protein